MDWRFSFKMKMTQSKIMLVSLMGIILRIPDVVAQSSIGCFVPIQCNGATSVGISMTNTPEECLDYCSEIAECNHFTHYSDFGNCFAYADCPDTDSDCSDCISGP